MNNVDVTKQARQLQGSDIWNRNNGKGTLNYVMRFGKTEVACIIIERLLTKRPDAQIIITVPSEAVATNWLEYLPGYFNNGIITRLGITSVEDYVERISRVVKVVPIGTLTNMCKITKPECTLLIVDEIHKFTSDVRYKTLLSVNYKYILGLTGTFPDGEEGKLVSAICPVIDVITEKEAIDNNWISPFIEYNIILDLPDEDKKKYAQFSVPIQTMIEDVKGIRYKFHLPDGTPLFRDDFDMLSAMYYGTRVLNQLGKSEYIKPTEIRQLIAASQGWKRDMNLDDPLMQQIDRYWNPTNLEARVKSFHDVVRKRNELLINHPLKLEAVMEIFKYSRKVTICFNESTDFADAVANGINARFAKVHPIAITYHSNIASKPLRDPVTNQWITYKSGEKAGQIKLFGKQTLKTIAIEGIRNGAFKFLSTARALDEGVTIANVEQVITTAGTANPIQYKQRTARGKTIDIYNPNKITQIFNICFDGFYDVDEKWVRSRDLTKLEYRQKDNFIRPITIKGLDGIRFLLTTS